MSPVLFVLCAYPLPESAWNALQNTFRRGNDPNLKRYLPEQLEDCYNPVFDLQGPLDELDALKIKQAMSAYRKPLYTDHQRSYENHTSVDDPLDFPMYVPAGIWMHFKHVCKSYTWPSEDQVREDPAHCLTYCSLWVEMAVFRHDYLCSESKKLGGLQSVLFEAIEDNVFKVVDQKYEQDWSRFKVKDLHAIFESKEVTSKARALHNMYEDLQTRGTPTGNFSYLQRRPLGITQLAFLWSHENESSYRRGWILEHIYPYLHRIHKPIQEHREERWQREWDYLINEHMVRPMIETKNSKERAPAAFEELWGGYFVEALMVQNVNAREYARLFCAALESHLAIMKEKDPVDRIEWFLNHNVNWSTYIENPSQMTFNRLELPGSGDYLSFVRKGHWLGVFEELLFPGEDPHKFLAFHEVYEIRSI